MYDYDYPDENITGLIPTMLSSAAALIAIAAKVLIGMWDLAHFANGMVANHRVEA